ncbi:uncharacterized protein MYCFIDRAFT_179925 [Pseudocercospora fijiensis CIRAD86]|uniref:Uncharacterized protein n=1 Tax=Pseudocercospora fijiensis (strain CIRAD86) TaxID=383855 RepID=M2ZYY7_PSEFD|nr:uncharacterized protein MYCFIDRAFT_179925 [Pseudocercospora fijiensis CIRAD86]EME77351.1 hypothetical protein MYCFIDRAFT_179925 [Pseudocercospora fijiensis CIRAD86]
MSHQHAPGGRKDVTLEVRMRQSSVELQTCSTTQLQSLRGGCGWAKTIYRDEAQEAERMVTFVIGMVVARASGNERCAALVLLPWPPGFSEDGGCSANTWRRSASTRNHATLRCYHCTALLHRRLLRIYAQVPSLAVDGLAPSSMVEVPPPMAYQARPLGWSRDGMAMG